MQTQVAAQQLVHAPRSVAEAGAQILQAGLAEVHQVGGHLGRLAGKLHRGEKHRQLPVVLANQIRTANAASQDPGSAHEAHELTPVQSLPQGHQVQQYLFQPLRFSAEIACLRQRKYGIA